jgi:hypothetical protein
VTQGVEQSEQEDMVEDDAVAAVAWPVPSSRECVVAWPRALGRVLSRGANAGAYNDGLDGISTAFHPCGYRALRHRPLYCQPVGRRLHCGAVRRAA